MKDSLSSILKGVQDSLEKIDTVTIDQMVTTLIQAHRIYLYGVGRSGLIGQAFAVRLVQMGFDVHFIGDMTTPIVNEGDAVIIVSNTGETMSAVQTANIVRRVGAQVISITANSNSKLAHASNLLIEISPKKDDQRKKLAPLGTIFEGAALALFDSIVPIMMEKLGQNEGDLRKRHAIWV